MSFPCLNGLISVFIYADTTEDPQDEKPDLKPSEENNLIKTEPVEPKVKPPEV